MKTKLFYQVLAIFGIVLFVGGMVIALQKQDDLVALLFGEEIAENIASYQQRYTPVELIELRIRGQLQPSPEVNVLVPLMTGRSVEEGNAPAEEPSFHSLPSDEKEVLDLPATLDNTDSSF